MKKILFFGFLLLGFASVSAQAPLEKGKLQLNARVGFATYEGIPISVGVDYGVGYNWTIGGAVDFRHYSESTLSHKITTNEFAVVGNFNYHLVDTFKLPSNFDLYIGGTIGYGYASHSYETLPTAGILIQNLKIYGDSSNVIQFHGQIGARYFFNDKMAVNLEVTGGKGASFNIGLTYKL